MPTKRIKQEPSDEVDDAGAHEQIDENLMQIDDGDDAMERDTNDAGEEEEDEIVREMDVYLSPELWKQLYLLQYPLQQYQTKQEYQSQTPLAARIKPQHNMLELDMGIPMNSIEQDGRIHLRQRTFASHTVPVTTHLALGKVVKQTPPGTNPDDLDDPNPTLALHLAPLKHIHQMRPTFDHIDQNDDEFIDNRLQDEKAKKKEQDNSRERKPLMFQKKESERAAMARKSSHAYKKASEDAEEWIPLEVLEVHDSDDDDDFSPGKLKALKQQLECPLEYQSRSVLEVADGNQTGAAAAAASNAPSLKSYVRSLDYLPAPPSTDGRGSGMPKTDNMDGTDSLDWQQQGLQARDFDGPAIVSQLTSHLCRGWPMPYSVLRQTLPPKVKEKDILVALSTCAFMVRGNFVLQSRLLKLPMPVAKARTFVLLLLQVVGVVHRRRLDAVFGLTQEETVNQKAFQDDSITAESILMLLEQVAKKTPHGWVLRGEPDLAFVKRFPQHAKLHEEFWTEQVVRYEDYLELYAGAD